MNTTYAGIFSYFSPEYGEYCDLAVKVEADDRYEAREKLWLELEKRPEQYFSDQPAKDIRLCGVNWQGSRIDMQDYFDAMAESCKTEINRMNNVDIPNERGRTPPNEEQMGYKKAGLSGEWSQLHLVDCIARDLYQAHGIIPPSIHTELYYAQKMADDLYRQKEYDLAGELDQRMWNASKWGDEKRLIQDLFREQYIYFKGDYHGMEKHFSRDGCFPVHTDTEYTPEQAQAYAQRMEMGGMS
ncbi:hypothetical protein [Oscillibacter sp.]|uniref:hypothetical protein n=1 Tax=Oscillibacter sp. TaxID=1945593 RepID=UPI00289FD955|nr:hypothetical protein [Oscillibacter sp.]